MDKKTFNKYFDEYIYNDRYGILYQNRIIYFRNDTCTINDVIDIDDKENIWYDLLGIMDHDHNGNYNILLGLFPIPLLTEKQKNIIAKGLKKEQEDREYGNSFLRVVSRQWLNENFSYYYEYGLSELIYGRYLPYEFIELKAIANRIERVKKEAMPIEKILIKEVSK